MDVLNIPNDLLFIVFQFLDVPTVVRRCTLVCKTWNKAIQGNDLLWKSLIKSTFSLNEDDINSMLSQMNLTNSTNKWFSLFRKIVSDWFSWDPEQSFSGITFEGKRTASAVSGSYLPLRGKLGVKRGIFFFEVNYNCLLLSDSLACGIGNASFETKESFPRGYITENSGIGWYASGVIFRFNVKVGERMSFQEGDYIGFLLNMNEGLVTFYRNHKRVSLPPQSISLYETIYPVFLMERNVVVETQQILNTRDYLINDPIE